MQAESGPSNSVPAASLPPPTGELPYDGAPSAADAGLIPRIPYHIEPQPQASGASASKAPAQPGTDEVEVASAKAAPKPPTKDKGAVAKAQGRKHSEPRPVTTKPAKAVAKAADRDERANAGKRATAGADGMEEDEIFRLRQQAVDELWRKRVRERMPEQGKMPAIPPGSLAAAR